MGKVSTCVADEGLQSKSDEEQLQFAAAGSHVFVTADTMIKVRKHERAALLSAGVQVVEFVFPDRYTMWERFQLMVVKWEQIEALLQTERYVVVRPKSVNSLTKELKRR